MHRNCKEKRKKKLLVQRPQFIECNLVKLCNLHVGIHLVSQCKNPSKLKLVFYCKFNKILNLYYNHTSNANPRHHSQLLTGSHTNMSSNMPTCTKIDFDNRKFERAEMKHKHTCTCALKAIIIISLSRCPFG